MPENVSHLCYVYLMSKMSEAYLDQILSEMESPMLPKTSFPDWLFDIHPDLCTCQTCDPEFHLEMGMDWEDAFELEPPF